MTYNCRKLSENVGAEVCKKRFNIFFLITHSIWYNNEAREEVSKVKVCGTIIFFKNETISGEWINGSMGKHLLHDSVEFSENRGQRVGAGA